MTTIAKSNAILQVLASVFAKRTQPVAHRPLHTAKPENDRTRWMFVAEMMVQNSEAFTSEMDVQGMMHCFPNRF